MVNPVTVNVGIIVPLTGADVDTWGEDDVNPNMVAIDGLFGGFQTISLTNLNVTLTKPAGFTATPSAGPTQAQNRGLKFTGVLTGNIVVTIPVPGEYIVENMTTGNFTVVFVGSAGVNGISTQQGTRTKVYCDGSSVFTINELGDGPGCLKFWAGLSSMPSWVGASFPLPFLLCDGGVYNVADFPYLGALLGSKFGGNGITTFGVPDLRGRVPLAYDGTGTRITTAGSGLNGQTLGASIDSQSNTLVANQIPAGVPSSNAAQSITVASTSGDFIRGASTSKPSTGGPDIVATFGSAGFVNSTGVNSISVSSTNASQQVVRNVQPSLVTGIYVIRT